MMLLPIFDLSSMLFRGQGIEWNASFTKVDIKIASDAPASICILCIRAENTTRTTMTKVLASLKRKSKTMRNTICSLCILLLAASLAGAQEAQENPAPGTTLKVTSEVVNVYAVVRGKDKRLIPDLTKADFQLEEDQQPQEIKYFSRATDTPLT